MARDSGLLFRLWLKDPFRIGAVAPSSRELAAAIARLVPKAGGGPVVELGGGTGVVTEALLEAGLGPERLIVVERDPTLHRVLERRFPALRVVLGDAAALGDALRPLGLAPLAAIVSGLPILSMRRAVQQAIVEQSFTLLPPGAPFIQFTYGLFSPLSRREFGLEGEVKERVLNNLPPASIWVYRRAAARSAAA